MNKRTRNAGMVIGVGGPMLYTTLRAGELVERGGIRGLLGMAAWGLMFWGIIALMETLSGCASNHYGREIPVIPEERSAYDCPAIALEIAKCDAFTKSVYDTWTDTKGRRFWAATVDLGIGDRRERNDALESAETRRAQLVELGREKLCPTPPPAPADD